MKLQFTEKSVFGRVLYYPACPVSETICNVAQRETFSVSELNKLSEHFELDVKAEVKFKPKHTVE